MKAVDQFEMSTEGSSGASADIRLSQAFAEYGHTWGAQGRVAATAAADAGRGLIDAAREGVGADQHAAADMATSRPSDRFKLNRPITATP